jgi:hypothetical protein
VQNADKRWPIATSTRTARNSDLLQVDILLARGLKIHHYEVVEIAAEITPWHGRREEVNVEGEREARILLGFAVAGEASERERRKGIFLFLLELFYLLPFRNPSQPSATFKFRLPPERHTFPTGVTRIGDWFHGPILPRVQRHNNEMNKLVRLKLHMF